MVPAVKALSSSMTGIEKLLKKEAGSTSAIAAKLTSDDRPCSRQLVQYWVKQGYVTGKWALAVNQKYDVPLHELNPSIYPKSAA